MSDEQILNAASDFRPSVVLLDLQLGSTRSALPLIPPLRATGAHVVILTTTTNVLQLAECVETGADGLLS